MDSSCFSGVGSLFGPLIVLSALLFILWYVFRSPRRSEQARGGRGTGSSTVLATLVVTHFLYEMADRAGNADTCLTPATFAGVAVVLAAGLVVAERFTERVVGLGGLMAFIAVVLLDDGPALATLYIVASVLMLTLVTMIRGFARSRT